MKKRAFPCLALLDLALHRNFCNKLACSTARVLELAHISHNLTVSLRLLTKYTKKASHDYFYSAFSSQMALPGLVKSTHIRALHFSALPFREKEGLALFSLVFA